ncbi:hypothetical protein [Paenibacillus ferrarius]|uniref:hypothetical protein n=1 Tax=Paenibacillus ferrarius TaxID=1469647 RepID=UPI003D2B310C
MRTIYENYRGFKINKDDNSYTAIHSNCIIMNQSPLSQVLDTIDSYIDSQLNTLQTDESSSYPQG